MIVEARVLRYHWREPNGAGEGEGVWTITHSGRLEGTWGFGKSSNNGGPWTLELASQRSQVAR